MQRPEEPQSPRQRELRDAFLAFVACADMDLAESDVDVLEEFHVWVLDEIWDSSKSLPDWHCLKLRLPRGSSYADALWNLSMRLG